MDQFTPPVPTSITATQQREVIDTAAIRTASFTTLQSNTWNELHHLTGLHRPNSS